MVLLPISDYERRLEGKRLVTVTSSFTSGAVKVFHNQPGPSSLVLNTISSSPTLSPLQKLPVELRLQILSMLFEDVKSTDWLSAHHHARATPASIIFTSKQMYLEGRHLALKACTFNYEDLPSECRVVGPYNGMHCDYQEDR